MCSLKRMWFNQPSTLQPHHNLHGTRVLACPASAITRQVYLLEGPVISMQVMSNTLSEGWPQREGVSDV